jgi:hypothetical protein
MARLTLPIGAKHSYLVCLGIFAVCLAIIAYIAIWINSPNAMQADLVSHLWHFTEVAFGIAIGGSVSNMHTA